jgi:hypothetical protein
VAFKPRCTNVSRALSGRARRRQPSALAQTMETTMKNVMCIVAIVLSLAGSANVALAYGGQGVVTGSESNRQGK